MPRAHDGLVAGAFAFFHEPRADPPDQWMEPEQRLHEHVQRASEVVTPGQVLRLVGQKGVDTRLFEMFEERVRNQENRPPEADEARLPRPGRGHHPHRSRYGQGGGRAKRRADLGPARRPKEKHGSASERPEREPDQDRNYCKGGGVDRRCRGLRERLGRRSDQHRAGPDVPRRTQLGSQAAQRPQDGERGQEFRRCGEPEAIADGGPCVAEDQGEEAGGKGE